MSDNGTAQVAKRPSAMKANRQPPAAAPAPAPAPAPGGGLRILRFESENVKRLVAVQITPDGNVIIVAGDHGSGKTSVLDAIMYAIGGKDVLPIDPIRHGEEKARTFVDLGEYTVERTFTAVGSYLNVKAKDGSKIKSPQALLDELTSSISFDPLEFSRMKPAEQAEILRKLLGIDFSTIDQARQAAYDERTDVGRRLKQAEGELAGLAPAVLDAPETEASASELIAELQRRVAINTGHDRQRHAIDDLLAERKRRADDLADNEAAQKRCGNEIAELERKLADKRAELGKLEERAVAKRKDVLDRDKAIAEARKAAAALVDENTAEIDDRLKRLERDNENVRHNDKRAIAEARIDGLKLEVAGHTAEIERLDQEKADLVAAAKFPVDGLTFGDNGVLYNGVPFEQVNTAQKIRISIAVGLASRPRLRVMLLREGNDINENMLATVGQMAAEFDAQLWIERWDTKGPVSVIIEEGRVKEVVPLGGF